MTGGEVAGTDAVRMQAALLQRMAVFQDLAPHALMSLAQTMGHHRFAAGERIIAEGDVGDRVYILVSGKADVTASPVSGPAGQSSDDTRIGRVGPGEMFGELALLSPGERRQATVTCAEDAIALSFSYDELRRLFGTDPFLQARLSRTADIKLTAKFLLQRTPFSVLPPETVEELAKDVTRRSFDAGTPIVRQGSVGDRCYVLRSGRIRVTIADEGEEREIAVLGEGTLFGEAALLSDSVRKATVTAVEASQCLLLYRSDLLKLMEDNLQIAEQIALRMRSYQRLKRVPGVELKVRSQGRTITHSLVNPETGAVFELSPEGHALWSLIDGFRGMDALVGACADKGLSLDGEAVHDMVVQLASAGFILDSSLPDDVQKVLRSAPSRHTGLYSFARRLFGLASGKPAGS